MSLPVAIISNENIYEFLENGSMSGLYFKSANNQNFLTYKEDEKFIHQKVENEDFILPKQITNLFYNFENPDFYVENLISTPFSILEIIMKNLNNLDFKKHIIIKPIYISKNIILNDQNPETQKKRL